MSTGGDRRLAVKNSRGGGDLRLQEGRGNCWPDRNLTTTSQRRRSDKIHNYNGLRFRVFEFGG